MKYKFPLFAGIIASATLGGTFAARYHHYFNDLDFLSKLKYDFLYEPEMKKYSEHTHENRLYELLMTGTDEEFEKELKKEEEFFADQYHVPKYPEEVLFTDSRTRLALFEDYETFFAYLQGKTPFLKESLKKGYFLDAFVLTEKLHLKKSLLLLKASYIQSFHAGIMQIIVDENIEEDFESGDSIGKIIVQDWLLRLSGHAEEIQSWNTKNTLKHFGETKKRIFDLARERYSEVLAEYPDLRSDHLDELLKSPIY